MGRMEDLDNAIHAVKSLDAGMEKYILLNVPQHPESSTQQMD